MDVAHFSVRPATFEDIDAIRPLLFQLGYDVPKAELERRLKTVLCAFGHFTFVAEAGAEILAVMHCFVRPALDKPIELVVQALVVNQIRRSSGIGARLMLEAEQIALKNGCDSVSLSSHERREDAHRFYRNLGYDHFATSAFFRKSVG